MGQTAGKIRKNKHHIMVSGEDVPEETNPMIVRLLLTWNISVNHLEVIVPAN
jgi:hypothetical protein